MKGGDGRGDQRGLGQAWQTFSIKGQVVNILDFVGHMASVTIIQLCWCSSKAAVGNTSRSECGCVPIKPYLQQWVAGYMWPAGHCFWAPVQRSR